VIGRLLSALTGHAEPGEFDVVVVANGCTDRTADIAASFGDVRVVETPVASKSAALRLGDEVAVGFPRLYVDADVVLHTEDLRALRDALARPGVLAAGPSRVLPMDHASLPVRWYYDVWQRLPGVRDELYGRGVVAVTPDGHRRLAALPETMADDLAAATAFVPPERLVVAESQVIIWPPRTYANLLRRRVRAMTGNRQLATSVVRRPPRTSTAELVRMTARDLSLAPRMVVFVATAVLAGVLARRAVRRGDFTTWLRDESSRA